METIYENNEVVIEIDRVDEYECRVQVNGKNLIWISRDSIPEFTEELGALLDRFRI